MNTFEYLNNCPLSDLQTVGWLAGIKAPAYFGKRELIRWIIKLLREDIPPKISERVRPDGITPESIVNCTAIIEKAKELIKEDSYYKHAEKDCESKTFSETNNIVTESIHLQEKSTETDNGIQLSIEECLSALKKASGIDDSKKLIYMIIDKLL